MTARGELPKGALCLVLTHAFALVAALGFTATAGAAVAPLALPVQGGGLQAGDVVGRLELPAPPQVEDGESARQGGRRGGADSVGINQIAARGFALRRA